MKKLIIVLLTVVLAGCATTPISTRDAIMVTGNSIISQAYSEKTEGSGEVIVKRDAGFGGSACSVRISIDALPMADLDIEEKVLFYLPPGEYILSAIPNSICGGGLSEIAANVKSGKQLTYRVGYGSNGDFFINRTAF